MQDKDNNKLNGIAEKDQLKRGRWLFGIIATLLLLIIGLCSIDQESPISIP